ncbi:hypothetical protein [Nitratireductor aestuarii]|uniref:hypothetical protein n=1 Tax=Nitratireductor aestuarii TaxID=1735103 RepID=UPI00166F1D44|nr:hypothetical protein [Nitratireductor aestuarii]
MNNTQEVGYETIGTRQEIDKKTKNTRPKSPYRDAHFRPLFQGLAHLHAARADGETSVIVCNPHHPLFPILRINEQDLSSLQKLPPFPLQPEELDDAELFADARHWSQFYADGPRLHRTPAAFRDLSDQASLEWFHHTLRVTGPAFDFTANLAPDVSEQAKVKPSAARWLRDRLSRRLKQQLGYSPEFWFIIEQSDRGLIHLHGEITINEDLATIEKCRKAMRLACGEWNRNRQHQVKLRRNPGIWWTNYVAKDAWKMRRTKFRYAPRRPINGDWMAATNCLRSLTDEIYTDCRKHVLSVLPRVMAKKAKTPIQRPAWLSQLVRYSPRGRNLSTSQDHREHPAGH